MTDSAGVCVTRGEEPVAHRYNGLISVTGGASGGLMLLAIFTTIAPQPAGAPVRRWQTPLLDATAALVRNVVELLSCARPLAQLYVPRPIDADAHPPRPYSSSCAPARRA